MRSLSSTDRNIPLFYECCRIKTGKMKKIDDKIEVIKRRALPFSPHRIFLPFDKSTHLL